MRWWILVTGVLGTLGLATAAHAAAHLDWAGSVLVGGAYFQVDNNDPGAQSLEDTQSREALANFMAFDNAYLHVGVQYTVTAVQLQQNHRLDYLDHQLELTLNVDRWLRHYTETGRLKVTASARISPSLPTLDPNHYTAAAAPPPPPDATDGTVGLTPTERFVRDDLLNIDENRKGYTFFYGLEYSDEFDPFRRYEVGWLVVDNRYKSSLVEDAAVLNARGLYAVRLSRGEAGVAARHQRIVKGSGNDEVYGLSVFRSVTSRRVDSRIEPGVSYRRDRQEYRASLRARWEATLPRATILGLYTTDVGVITIGRTAVVREHRGYLGVETPHNLRFPRSFSVSGSVNNYVRRMQVTVAQSFRIFTSLRAVLSYSRSGIWWEDAGTGADYRRVSDVVAFNLRWSFL